MDGEMQLEGRRHLFSSVSTTNEPVMLLQRPSSSRSQDVRHILTQTFKDLFAKEPISAETIKNLITTRGSDDEYHERYVSSLKEIYDETESKLNEIAMLEQHIMQAQAIAMSADERFTDRAADGKPELGLPVGSNHFRSCLDYDLLKQHKLLTPDIYANYPLPKISKPVQPSEPGYLQETQNFVNASKGKKERKNELRKSRFNYDIASGSYTIASPLENGNQNVSTEDEMDKESENYTVEGSEVAAVLRDTITRDDQQAARPIPNTKKSGKLNWTEQLAVDLREQERLALAKLQNRTNYLKNPRFDLAEAKLLVKASRPPAKEISIKRASPELEPLSNVQVFVPIPSTVTFTEYQVGRVYEATLELKNISAALRPVRVLPTKTNFFSVGLGQFPGEQGLVASGMSAHFKVRFMPDSLGEYTDEIEVVTQCSTPLIVNVIAKRPPPVLTLPSRLEVGECLVGGTKVTMFTVRNDGGAGRFCMIQKERWPVTNFKSAVNPAVLDAFPFHVRPTVFELGHGEATRLEVVFQPVQVKRVSQAILMMCDNCHLKEFMLTGEGQIAGVEFVAVDGGTSVTEPGELCDETSQKLIRFDSLNPYTYTQKTLILSNTTNVALPYEWKIVKPHIIPKDAQLGGNVKPTPTARALDAESAFSIEPQNGVLEASGLANFKLTFAPPEVNKYNSVLHLVLPNVPSIIGADEAEGQAKQGSSTAPSYEKVLIDVTALEVECKGECVPVSVLLQPYAIFVNGRSLIGTTVRRQFLLVNNSVSTITFQWVGPQSGTSDVLQPNTSNNILEITPALGEVDAGTSASMEISITGCSVGKMHEVLYCHVKHLADPIALHVEFEVKGPEIFLDEPDVNFGLVRFGTTTRATLTLRNESQIPASFTLREKLPANQTTEKSEFVFNPSTGELRPLEMKKITVEFYPQSCKVIRTFFELLVADGGVSSTIAVRADVQNPDVCLLSCDMRIPKLFVNMPMTQIVTIVNKTMLQTQYHWGNPVGSQADLCTIQLMPSGVLGPRENAELEVTFTAKSLVDITDVVLPCHIAGMEEPLLLAITAHVEGLQIAYAVQDRPDMPNFDETTVNSSSVEFGTVEVETTAKKYLYLRNKTSITTQFKISMLNFGSRPPTPPANRFNVISTGRKPLLSKTPNIADSNSKSKDRALIELQQQLLKTDRGLAIVPTPSSGQLAPYEELVVELAVYSDMWGLYSDILTCHVGDLDPYQLPVTVNIAGIPLHFHMASSTFGKEPMLRFGTHASNASSITRAVRINNHSPYDIRLDWQMYNVVPDDKQLIDLVVLMGEDFPLRDEQGNEITATTVEEEIVTARPPTECLPSTPDSSMAPSRLNRTAVSQLSSYRQVQSRQSVDPIEPLLKVIIRPHDGQSAVKPFSVQPTQMIIPARDKGFMKLTFNPESGDPMGESCLSYILGYLNLDSKAAHTPLKVSRVVGYSMLPLKLSLSGCIQPAFLGNEFLDDEGLRFRAVASDLIKVGERSLRSAHSISTGTKVTNLTEARLQFKLDIPDPFYFAHSLPSLAADNTICLKPNESAEIHVSFKCSPDQIALAERHPEKSPDAIGTKPIVLIRSNTERQIHICGSLKICFTSGAIQELPLHASLVLPSLTIDRLFFDFGTCLVGQPKQQTFVIKNTTLSASFWSAQMSNQSPSCLKDTFVINPSSGLLVSQVTHVSKSDMLVTVTFLAREDCYYEAEFTLTGLLGEEPRVIHVKGSGSFDEKHKDVLDVQVQPES